MAIVPTMVTVAFLDSAERISKITYRLSDSVAVDDAALPTTIVTAIGAMSDLTEALKDLSWSEVLYAELSISQPVADGGANVAANNQVTAFVRTRTDSGEKSSFEVPAWDDLVYDQNSQNVLSAAWVTAANNILPLIADMETGEDIASIDYAQSRTRKSRNVIHD